MTARSDEPDVKSLPLAGEAVWLSNFRPNIPHGLYRCSKEGTAPPIVGTQYLRKLDGTLDDERYTPRGLPHFHAARFAQPDLRDRDGTGSETYIVHTRMYSVIE